MRAQYRPDLQLIKSGCSSIAGFFKMKVDINDELALMKKYVMGGNLGRAILSDSHSLLFMKFIDTDGEPNLLWSISWQTDFTNEKFGELSTDKTTLKEQLVQRLTRSECSPETLKLFDLTPDENLEMPRPGVMMQQTKDPHIRPSDLPQQKCRVLLIGDAAHAMTTHAGRGANTAFNDAIQLCNVLHDHTVNLHSGPGWLKGHEMFEKAMFTNGFKAMAESHTNTERIHKVDNEGSIKFMRLMGGAQKLWNLATKGSYSLF